jgi:hypothetical protein
MQVKILSLAPRYSKKNSNFGHWTIVQELLKSGADQAGIPFSILAPLEQVLISSVINVIDATSEDSILNSLKNFLSSHDSSKKIILFIYEANLSMVSKLNALARIFPNVNFVVNLHYPENILGLPGTDLNFRRTYLEYLRNSRESDKIKTSNFELNEENLKIITESESRTYLAESWGLQIAGTWPGISQIASNNKIEPFSIADNKSFEIVRVYIPISSARFTLSTAKDVREFINFSEKIFKLRGIRYEFKFGFSLSELKLAYRVFFKFLGGKHVKFQQGNLSNAEYVLEFADCDLVWLPYGPEYVTHSSGKTLDSLLSGKFMLAKSGTYPAKEYSRWFRGYPTYGNRKELRQLIFLLEHLLPNFSERISKVHDDVLKYYSAENAIRFIVDISKSCSGKSSTGESKIRVKVISKSGSASYLKLFLHGDSIIRRTIMLLAFDKLRSRIRS